MIQGCKGVGTSFSSSKLVNTLLQDCILELANLDGASLEKLAFRGCSLNDVWFTECKLKQLALEDCTLTHPNFFRTPLAGVDFTRCRLSGLVCTENGAELKGAIVTPEQAVELARLLGLVVRP